MHLTCKLTIKFLDLADLELSIKLCSVIPTTKPQRNELGFVCVCVLTLKPSPKDLIAGSSRVPYKMCSKAHLGHITAHAGVVLTKHQATMQAGGQPAL